MYECLPQSTHLHRRVYICGHLRPKLEQISIECMGRANVKTQRAQSVSAKTAKILLRPFRLPPLRPLRLIFRAANQPFPSNDTSSWSKRVLVPKRDCARGRRAQRSTRSTISARAVVKARRDKRLRHRQTRRFRWSDGHQSFWPCRLLQGAQARRVRRERCAPLV
jgi:hypothetical protein